MREAIRTRHYSLRTEKAYCDWVRRYVRFHGLRHPGQLGGEHVAAFLSFLANDRHVSASTQNQALAAVLFLYREVLQQDLPWLEGVVRAKRPRRLPVVLTRAEVDALLAQMEGVHALMARLMYGTGMRLMECLRLRVKDIDIARREVIVRQGKGRKDRITMFPTSLREAVPRHLIGVRRLFTLDRANDVPGVELPEAYAVKNPSAATEWAGSGSFPRTTCRSIPAAAFSGATTPTTRPSSARSSGHPGVPAS